MGNLKFLVILLCFTTPVFATTTQKQPKPINQTKKVTQITTKKIPPVKNTNIQIQKTITSNTTSTPNIIIKKNKSPLSIVLIIDNGKILATGDGYPSTTCQIERGFSIGAEYDLGKINNVFYGAGIRYQAQRNVNEFKAKFGSIPIYGFCKLNLFNDLSVNAHAGYAVSLNESKTKVSGKWTGGLYYGAGIGYKFFDNFMIIGEYNTTNTEYKLNDFKMNWAYNTLTLGLAYNF